MYESVVTITGNVSRDPELRFTPSGVAVASLAVAVNHRRKEKGTDEWIEQVSFYDVTCWNQLAENVSESIMKGARVTVVGRMEQQNWETPDGDKRSKLVVIAEEVAASLKWATCEISRNERGDSVAAPPARKKAADYSQEPF